MQIKQNIQSGNNRTKLFFKRNGFKGTIYLPKPGIPVPFKM